MREVDITVEVKLQAKLPKDFIAKYKDLEEDDLSCMFYEELFPIWFDVTTNGDEVIIANRDDETVDIYFTFESCTMESYRPGDWYTPDEYSWNFDRHDFPIPKDLLIYNTQTFEAH